MTRFELSSERRPDGSTSRTTSCAAGMRTRCSRSASRASKLRAPTQAALAAIDAADVIVIAPSNPFVSVAPILSVVGLRAALSDARAPVIGVSPIVGGAAVRGPAAAMMGGFGLAASARASPSITRKPGRACSMHWSSTSRMLPTPPRPARLASAYMSPTRSSAPKRKGAGSPRRSWSSPAPANARA